MIRAIIFDLNGVFIESRKLSDRFAEDFGVPPEKFMPALREIMEKVRQPNAGGSFRYWEPYLKEWGIKMSEKEFFDYWFGGERINSELFDFAKKLKRNGLKILVLSNNFIERSEYYAQNFPELMSIFDGVYYSWETGFKKPDSRAYEFLIRAEKLEPVTCLYFDDSENNIEVAREFGIKSFLYEGLEKTREIINKEDPTPVARATYAGLKGEKWLKRRKTNKPRKKLLGFPVLTSSKKSKKL